MMGTGPFAVPTFRALLRSPHEVLALVTRPDKPQHRREKSPPNPMREVAKQHQREVYEPENVNLPPAQAWLRDKRADLFIVCDYGQILSQETLGLAHFGGINLHASLLPKYRGAAPINWAIYHGEQETGVTVIHMTPKLDAGPALVQRRIAIGPNEMAPQLEARLSELGVGAISDAIEIVGRESIGMPQDQTLTTKAPRLKKENGLVNWSRTAREIVNQVRAFQPWPKTFTHWNRGEGELMRLILESVQEASAAIPPSEELKSPGTIVKAHGDELLVATGEGLLQIDAIQPSGKKILTAGEFLRGYHLQPGARFS
jgi:methionyl-tRNA formyltransferase